MDLLHIRNLQAYKWRNFNHFGTLYSVRFHDWQCISHLANTLNSQCQQCPRQAPHVMGRIKNDDIIVIISPRMFSLGGKAIFMEIASSHIIEREGIVVMDLFIKKETSRQCISLFMLKIRSTDLPLTTLYISAYSLLGSITRHPQCLVAECQQILHVCCCSDSCNHYRNMHR